MPKIRGGEFTLAKVEALAEPGMYSEHRSPTLYLNVAKRRKDGSPGAKTWIQRIVVQGRRRDIGLGALRLVSIQEARDLAIDNERAVRRGENPFLRRDVPIFREAVDKFIALNRHAWKGARTELTWRTRLETHAFPIIGEMLVTDIRRAHLLEILEPLWNTKHNTARKLKTALGQVMAYCVAKEYIAASPARSDLAAALPPVTAKGEHFRALPWAEMPDALAQIQAAEKAASLSVRLCLALTILTAARSGETRGATWKEIDMDAAVWTIPAERMKADREHRVPLSAAALDVLRQARDLGDDGSDLVFPSPMKPGKALSEMTMTFLLQRIGLAERATVHGFRSSFRTWAGENTSAPEAVMEKSLAHKVGSKVEQAYDRAEFMEKRRVLMEQWAAFVTGAPAPNVASMEEHRARRAAG